MGNIGPLELVVVAIIALLVIGPQRLPEAARSVGKGMREMRAALSGERGDDDPAARDAEDEDDEEDDGEDHYARAADEDEEAGEDHYARAAVPEPEEEPAPTSSEGDDDPEPSSGRA